MDAFSNKQPPRTYPFYKGLTSTIAEPVTGETPFRSLQKVTNYNLAASSPPIIIDTGLPDANGLIGGIDLGKLVGGQGNDEFVLQFVVASLTAFEAGGGTDLTISSGGLYIQNQNTPLPVGAGTLWQSNPVVGLLSSSILAFDLAPSLQPIRWDDYKYIDDRTTHLFNVIMGGEFVVSNSVAGARQLRVVSNFRYIVQNLNSATLPIQVQQ